MCIWQDGRQQQTCDSFCEYIWHCRNPLVKKLHWFLKKKMCLVLSQGTFIFSLVKYTPVKFNNTVVYPWWGYALGWWFTLSSTLMVPLFMLYSLSITPGTLRQVSSTWHLIFTFYTFITYIFFTPLFHSVSVFYFFYRGFPSCACALLTFLWPNQKRNLLNCFTSHLQRESCPNNCRRTGLILVDSCDLGGFVDV